MEVFKPNKKTGTPFRKTLVEQSINSQIMKVQGFLNQDFIFETNQGYGIDVLKLVDSLDDYLKSRLFRQLLKSNEILDSNN